MDIYLLVWDKLKMCGGIRVVKCILSHTLMIGSIEGEQRNANLEVKLNKVCIKSWSMLLYVLRPY